MKQAVSLFIVLLQSVLLAQLSWEEQLRRLNSDFLIHEEPLAPQKVEMAEEDEIPLEEIALTEDEESLRAAARPGGPSMPTGAGVGGGFLNHGGHVVPPRDTSVVEEGEIDSDDFDAETFAVRDAGAIDFERTIENYKSPQRALVLSLLLPGAGQVYLGQGWKAAAFGAVEVGLIVGSIEAQRAHDRSESRSKRYADTHFDSDRLEQFYKTGADLLAPAPAFDGDPALAERWILNDWAGYGNRDYASFHTTHLASFYDHSTNGYGVGAYFSTPGWRDRWGDSPSFHRNGSETQLASSIYQDDYRGMVDDAMRYEDRRNMLITFIVINHISSAAEAFIAAHRVNRRMLASQPGEAQPHRLENLSFYRGLGLSPSGTLLTNAGVQWRF